MYWGPTMCQEHNILRALSISHLITTIISSVILMMNYNYFICYVISPLECKLYLSNLHSRYFKTYLLNESLKCQSLGVGISSPLKESFERQNDLLWVINWLTNSKLFYKINVMHIEITFSYRKHNTIILYT